MNALKQRYSLVALEAGCDEAGRGCLAGPVVAAAVILDNDTVIEGLRDSKKLSARNRTLLRAEILSKAIDYAVAFVDNETIDKINILKASIHAMHIALGKLRAIPEFIIVDGNKFIPYNNIPHQCIVGGDDKFLSIAAASVLAKTARDEYMEQLHEEFPHYNWKSNKGYPTQAHKEALLQYGQTIYHRRSFRLGQQLKIF